MKTRFILFLAVPLLLWNCASEGEPEKEEVPDQTESTVTGTEPTGAEETEPDWRDEMSRLQIEGDLKGLIRLADEYRADLDESERVLYLSLLLTDGRTDEARELGAQLLTEQPENVNVLYMNALLADLDGRYEDALDLVEKGYALDENHPDINLYLAELELRDGDYNEANDYLNVVLDREPENFSALVGKADVYMHLGEGDEELNEKFLTQAVKILDRVEAIAPDYVYTYVDRSRALAVLGEHRRAMEDLNRAIELEPQVEWHYLDRIVLNLKYFGHLEKALEDIASLEAINPNNLFCHIYAAGVNDDLREYDVALDYYEKVIAARPDYPYSYEGAGKIYYMKGDYPRAETCFLKAYDLAYPYEGYLLMAGLALRNQGEKVKAKKLLSDGIRTIERDTLMYEVFRYFIDAGSDYFLTNMITKETDKDLRNKAYFYWGEMMLLQDSPQSAAAGFGYLADSQGFFEADIAKWHLEKTNNQ